jgi:nitric-oxide synthase
MVTAVGGHGGYPGGKQFVSAEELREKLSYLRHEKALIVKLVNKSTGSANLNGLLDCLPSAPFWSLIWPFIQVDIVDFNGSFLARVRDFAGANPIILVITKVLVFCTQFSFFLVPILLLPVSQPKLFCYFFCRLISSLGTLI